MLDVFLLGMINNVEMDLRLIGYNGFAVPQLPPDLSGGIQKC